MVSKKSKKQAKLAAAAAGAQADSADAEEATLPENDPSYDQPIEIPEEPDPDINAEDDFDEFTPVGVLPLSRSNRIKEKPGS